jgi:hypothetical protein
MKRTLDLHAEAAGGGGVSRGAKLARRVEHVTAAGMGVCVGSFEMG